MNWHKANQALGNIERLMQVFETSGNLSSIERDLLLRRIQDLYEIILKNEVSKVDSTTTVKTAPKPIVTPPPVVEKPKVEPKVEPKEVEIEVPKKEVQEEKPIIKIPTPVKPPKVEKPKVEEAKVPVKTLQKPVTEQPTYQEQHQKPYQEPVVTSQFDEEEAEIIEALFEFKIASDLSEKLSASPIRDLTTSMSINERFITISELFKGNKSKYDEAVHELNNFNNFEQAKSYILNHLINEYDWTNKKKIKSVKAFIKKVRRRYL